MRYLEQIRLNIRVSSVKNQFFIGLFWNLWDITILVHLFGDVHHLFGKNFLKFFLKPILMSLLRKQAHLS